jgi:uncharacterized protein involved in outer membrane biogenesis
MKTAKRIALVVVALVVIGLLAVYFNLNRIVRRTIEVQATDSLTLQTKVGGARLALFGGQLKLDDMTIASPQGYAAPHMLALDSGSVEVSYGELNDDPVRINSMTLRKPRLVIEQSNGKFNFQVLSETGSQTPQDSGTPSDGNRQEGEPIRVIIEKLKIENAAVVLRPGLPGLDQEIVVDVPTIELSNVGTGGGSTNGAAIKDVVMEIISALAEKSGNANIPEQLQKQLKQGAEQVANRVRDEARKQVESLTGRVDDQLKGTGINVGESVNKELGNLLGGAKDKDAKEAEEKKERKRERQ